MPDKIMYYLFTFFFFSAIGWTVESTYRSLGERRVINSGFLHGPLCPIYGSGALVFEIILVPLSQPFEKRWWVVLVLGVICADTVEYITSFLMEKLFHARWWDYTGNFLNINGRICFKHSCYWAIASFIYCYIVSPLYSVAGSFISDKIKTVIVIAVLIIFALDLIVTVKAAINVQNIMKKLEAIRDTLELAGGFGIAGTDTMLENAGKKVKELRRSAEEHVEEFTASVEKNYEELKETILAFKNGDGKNIQSRETKRLFVSYSALREKVVRSMNQIENGIRGLSDDKQDDPEDKKE